MNSSFQPLSLGVVCSVATDIPDGELGGSGTGVGEEWDPGQLRGGVLGSRFIWGKQAKDLGSGLGR